MYNIDYHYTLEVMCLLKAKSTGERNYTLLRNLRFPVGKTAICDCDEVCIEGNCTLLPELRIAYRRKALHQEMIIRREALC